MECSIFISVFIVCHSYINAFTGGFVMKNQVSLPEPKLTELSQLSQHLRPKVVKATYEVTFLVEENNLDTAFYSGRSAGFDTKLVTSQPPTLIKVESSTESLVKKEEDDVPVIKGYDPDGTKRLAESLDEIKKQTDQKVNVDGSRVIYNNGGWTSSWRPIARADNRRVPYNRDYPPPCCSPESRSQPRIHY